MPKDFTEWTRLSLDEGRVYSQYMGLSINPTFRLAERLLMCRSSRNREAHTEPNHNQRV
jgi:hypothetical protein